MLRLEMMTGYTINNRACKPPPTAEDWQTALSTSVRDVHELCRLLDLPAHVAAEAASAAVSFPLLTPRCFLARIKPGDPHDPLLLQVLPRAAESTAEGDGCDPLGEADAVRGPGLLAKYQGRILILATAACPVHCRFCFRRHFTGQALPEQAEAVNDFLDAIAADQTIHEVILSGGDPLMLHDEALENLCRRLDRVGHLRRLRIHTRMPIVIPQRVTPDLLDILIAGRLTPIVVLHVNHPAELNVEVEHALAQFNAAGIPLLSQTVLLRGVNDRGEVLLELFERLTSLRVIPYYLHQVDAVAGAAHFAVPIAEGLKLMAWLRRRLPGYAVPRYVRELRGAPAKLILA